MKCAVRKACAANCAAITSRQGFDRGTRARPATQALRLEFDDEFADVVAAEKHVDGFGSFFEALDDGLFVFEFASHSPHAELLARVHEFRSVIENDETFDAEALDENLGETGERRVLLGVTGDKAAQDDATVEVHAVEDGLHDFAADVFEIDVDASGSGGDELSLPVRVFVVDGSIEAEILFNPFAFFIGAGNANDAAAVNFADLSDDAAGGAGGGGNDEGFAGLRFADIEQTEISG